MNNKRLVLAWVILLFIYAPFTVAQSSLPKQVQADLLKKEIQSALSDKDFPTLIEKIEAYESLDVTMPPPLIFLESKARYATGDTAGAIRAMEAYFEVADQDTDRYLEALDLYTAFSAKLQTEIAEQKANAEKVAFEEAGLSSQTAASEGDVGAAIRHWLEYLDRKADPLSGDYARADLLRQKATENLEVLMLTEGDAVLIHVPDSQYPQRALSRGIQGSCEISYRILETGDVGDVEVLKCGARYRANNKAAEPDLLMNHAVSFVSAWKYKPKVVNGKPIASERKTIRKYEITD